MKSTQWRTNPTRFLAMTGYTSEQFDALLPFFEEAHDDYLQRFHLGGKPGEGYRRFVFYQNSPLPTHAERLIFVLTSLRGCLTFHENENQLGNFEVQTIKLP